MTEREVLELKAQLTAEYKRECEALDVLLAMLRRRRNGTSPSPAPESDATPEPQPSPKQDNNGARPKRARGILAVTRAIFDQLPDPFSSVQLKDKLEENPEFAGMIKMDSLRGTLKTLSDEGWIKQIAEGAGPRPALYKHLRKAQEKAM